MEGFFPAEIRYFELWRMPELLNFSFPEGSYFLNCDNTKLKIFSKNFFSVSERHRWAVVGLYQELVLLFVGSS